MTYDFGGSDFAISGAYTNSDPVSYTHLKGKDRLIFMKDGDIVDIKGKGKIQDFINREIGLSYTLFMNSILFGQGIKRLIQESNSDKKKIFEEVFDLEFLNLAKGIALQDKNNLISQINEVEHESQMLRDQDGFELGGAVIGLFRFDETEFTEETALMVTESNEIGYFEFD